MAPTARPNILFLFPDQHRYDWHGLDGRLPVRTPHLRDLATRGVRFTHAVTPSPLCAPARAAIALGGEYGRNGPVLINNCDLPEAARGRTFYNALQAAGYNVASCGKLDLNKASHSWGRDGRHVSEGRSAFEEWGFTHGCDCEGKGPAGRFAGKPRGPYGRFLRKQALDRIHEQDFKSRKKPGVEISQYLEFHATPLPDEAYHDNWVGAQGLDLIGQLAGKAPWFLQVNFPGPHPPMDVTATMKEWYADVRFPDAVRNTRHGRSALAQIRRDYSAMVENIDRWLGEYVARLAALGILENTVIVYASDHGEMLGDHGRFRKHVPYQASVGVPLVIAGPGLRAGVNHAGPSTLLDLPATFLELAGRGPTFNESRSLLGLLRGDAGQGREFVRSAYAHWTLVFDGRFKLVRGFEPASATVPTLEDEPRPDRLLLFDLEEDPDELTDRASDSPETVGRMRPWLEEVTP